MKIVTAKEFFEEHLSGEPLTQDSVIEAMKLFARMQVRYALKITGVHPISKEDDDDDGLDYERESI